MHNKLSTIVSKHGMVQNVEARKYYSIMRQARKRILKAISIHLVIRVHRSRLSYVSEKFGEVEYVGSISY